MPNTTEDIVYKHHKAINTQDEREYLDSVKFPFTYQNYNSVLSQLKMKKTIELIIKCHGI